MKRSYKRNAKRTLNYQPTSYFFINYMRASYYLQDYKPTHKHVLKILKT